MKESLQVGMFRRLTQSQRSSTIRLKGKLEDINGVQSYVALPPNGFVSNGRTLLDRI